MLSFWKSEDVFLNGDDYFKQVIQDINEARHLVTVEVYIFNDDVLGQRIAQALIGAARRGVTVQLLVDGVGSHHFFQTLYDKFCKEKISIKVFNPLPFLHPYFGSLTTFQKINAFFVRLFRMNSRDHRKIITIDEHILFVGSFNVTAEHTTLLGLNPWKDSAIRVTGAHVGYAVLQFKRLWKLRDFYHYKKKTKPQKWNWKTSPLRLNNTLFMRRFFHKDFVKRMKHSQKRIWLMTPYFIPTRSFIKALSKAAERGVDVKILLSSKTDVDLFLNLQTYYYPFLIKSGVQIFLYTESVLHAKTYIFDDWMSIGTSNLNHRSLMHDLEVDLVVQNPENCKIVEEDFKKTIESLAPLTMTFLNEQGFINRTLSAIYFIFRYWL